MSQSTALTSAEASLADALGIQTVYRDVFGGDRKLKPDVLRALAASLGVPASSEDEINRFLERSSRDKWCRLLEPVVVAWEGRAVTVELRLRADELDAPITFNIKTEDGRELRLESTARSGTQLETASLDGRKFVKISLRSFEDVPLGYHRLRAQTAERQSEALLVSAPAHLVQPPADSHAWGVFVPIYSLPAKAPETVGTFAQLAETAKLVRSLGGNCVGTLPLLAAFLDEPFEPSPYSPVSRLFWNELYIDLETAPGFSGSSAASELGSEQYAQQTKELREAETVNYRESAALKRKALSVLAGQAWKSPQQRAELQKFIEDTPMLDAYARFRALTELRGKVWQEWDDQDNVLDCPLPEEAVESYRYHCYCQWVCSMQLQAVSEAFDEDSPGLYLDFPLGVNPAGFDHFFYRAQFVEGASAGAPPDTFFTAGQDWGFAPLNPVSQRESYYSYFIDAVRSHMRFAGSLRIDHVMQFHRLFCIPKGFAAVDGAYVSFPWQEIYAILCLESHRTKTVVIGENLGTVPESVVESMSLHKMWQLYVLQYEMLGPAKEGPTPPVEHCVCSVNTHDQAPFAAFLRGLDLELFEKWGLLTESEHRQETSLRSKKVEALRAMLVQGGYLKQHERSEKNLLGALLRWLAGTDSKLLLINLQDLLLDTRAQNMPGTTDEHVNWRYRLEKTPAEIASDEAHVKLFRDVNNIRNKVKTSA